MSLASTRVGSEVAFGIVLVLWLAAMVAVRWRWSAVVASWRDPPSITLRTLLCVLCGLAFTVIACGHSVVLRGRIGATLWVFATLVVVPLGVPALVATLVPGNRRVLEGSEVAPATARTTWALWIAWALAVGMTMATSWALTFWMFSPGPTS